MRGIYTFDKGKVGQKSSKTDDVSYEWPRYSIIFIAKMF